MLKLRLISILLVSIYPCFGQQNNIWYFGRKAGLNFNLPGPAVLHNSAMNTNEGSASICDISGNLLFYTNGETVYNRNHVEMVNGTGLKGNVSTVQSALIVPKPGNPNIYYIFTTDAIENNYDNGYNYSVVDMSLAGGLGEVITKNVLMTSSCTERLTACRHADGSSVWIITNDNNSNVFRAWLMDCTGLSTTPVVSTTGAVLNTNLLMNTGMMKVSPDGKQLCQTHFPYLETATVIPNFIQLFDFDNATGIISNPKSVTLPDAQINNCEYSPNSMLLYLARPLDKKINQIESRLPTAAAIEASSYTINTVVGYYGIQLAPDQKIYLAYPSNFLGVIKNPDTKGVGCDFRQQYLNVTENIGGLAYLGLPSYINDLSYDGSNGFNYLILDSCSGRIQFNGFTALSGTVNWSWDFGDGFTSTLQNPVHSFSSSQQQYTVKLTIQSANGCGLPLVRTKSVMPTGLMLNPGFSFKVVCDSGYARFTNTGSFSPDTAQIQYYWDFGDGNFSTQQNPVHNYAGGNYTVRLTVKTTTACLDKTISMPLTMEAVTIQASPDMQIDQGQSIPISVTGTGSRFNWVPAESLSDPRVPNPIAKPRRSTMYVVTVYNDNGCSARDSVFIKVKPIPGIYVPSGFTPNSDGKNDVFRPTVADDHLLHEFSIYNRWGQLLYRTTQKDACWNGKINGVMQDNGVYVWTVSATDTVTNKKLELKGTFVIIR